MILRKLFLIFIAVSFLFISCGQQSKNQRSRKNRKEKKSVVVPKFNADSAYVFVEKQVSFGPRVPETKAHAACADWLATKLGEYADTVIVQPFKARTYDKITRNGKNIIASFKPEVKKRVLLMAHWDSRPYADYDTDESNHRTPIDAANDGGSGVGVLLEAARQFHMQKPDVGVDIVFFDLEDWGPPRDLGIYDEELWGLGSQYWSKKPHVRRYKASFGILLDMVGNKNPTFRREYFSRTLARYVQDLVWSTAWDLGYQEYFLDDNGPAINDDHVFVNRIANIPSIDIIHLNPANDESSFFEHWHTTNDVIDHIDKRSLGIVGEVVLTVVYNE
jgi:Zn-dependent M28 family amino/carboxypeptidase